MKSHALFGIFEKQYDLKLSSAANYRWGLRFIFMFFTFYQVMLLRESFALGEPVQRKMASRAMAWAHALKVHPHVHVTLVDKEMIVHYQNV